MRTQIGFSNITINFNCPNCHTQITGLVTIPSEPKPEMKNLGIEFLVNNAEVFNSTNDLADFVVELSSEFLQQKVVKDDDYFQPTPFIRSFASYGKQGIDNLIRLKNALIRLFKYKNEYTIISNLWNSEKFRTLIIKLNEMSLTRLMIDTWKKPKAFKITNELEMLMVVHQSRVFLLSPFIEKNRRNRILDYPTTFNKIINSSEHQKIVNLSKLLGDKKYYIDFEKRMHEITLQYMEILPDFIPLLNSMDELKTDITSGKYTVTTKHVALLTAFYAKAYELFCDKIDLIIGLNNITVRGNCNLFCVSSAKVGFDNVINSFNSKYMKLSSLLCVFDTFSLPYTGLISNKIRNAEGHFDRDFNIDKNTIIFKDSHRGRVSEIEMDYLEFCSATIKLFNALNELFEVSYQMDKLYRISLIGTS
ncbi:hypothetical protein HF295_02650 [Hujiaoplasma nucleasis]|uniref:Uncharacterized protein n=1 Tax=Hujiaoplasma nucleasis TaxID=2725268 RepID=A0A7L6N3K0_9MOLU|nr:hypothetical protein [Hujiaoplasma nucleasis]QLY39817.1 hypothetical protein HF295_02650 [Hujiaoplasma nucleasis]